MEATRQVQQAESAAGRAIQGEPQAIAKRAIPDLAWGVTPRRQALQVHRRHHDTVFLISISRFNGLIANGGAGPEALIASLS